MAMSVDPQDKWVAAGAAAIPFVVVLVALRLLNLPTAIRLRLVLPGVAALLLFGVGLYSLPHRRRQKLSNDAMTLSSGLRQLASLAII